MDGGEVLDGLGAVEDDGRPPARSVREVCERAGATEEQIRRAERDGTLALLALDRLAMPAARVYTQAEIAGRSGMGEDADRFWRAFGFPDPDPDDVAFTEDDLGVLEVLRTLQAEDLLEQDRALQMARVIGSAVARIAQAQVESVEERNAVEQQVDDELAARRTEMLVPIMPAILDYAWRRHIQSAARRRLVRTEVDERGLAADGSMPSEATVGFADMVGFTALSQQLTETDLTRVVDRFEAVAYDTIGSLGGRVVKMIGDEVMFAVATPRAGVEVGLALAEAYRNDDSISDVRVGLAHGGVVRREGDLFGPTVNLASRIVSIAYPGSVVASGEVRAAVGDDERFAWKALRTRHLKDIGRVQLAAVRRAGDPFEKERTVDRARRRRGSVRDRVAELLDEAAEVGEQRVQQVVGQDGTPADDR